DLGEKALGPEDGAELRVEDLERDAAVVANVAGEEDGRHPATADFAVDRVPAFERGGQARGRHGDVGAGCAAVMASRRRYREAGGATRERFESRQCGWRERSAPVMAHSPPTSW